MKTSQYYPVIQTEDVKVTVAFYRDHLRFEPAFESSWYVHLQSTEDPSVNVAGCNTITRRCPRPFSGRVPE